MSDWCILRTSGRNTLGLAESLSNAGFDSWTPQEVLVRRATRAKTRVERPMPIMPTFVFARARDVSDLIRLAATPRKKQPDFSVFHYQGRIPLVSDRAIEPLRTAELRAVPKARKRMFQPGQAVHLPEGAFTGLSGIVEESNGKFTLVCFGRTRVKIDTFLLRPDDANKAQLLAGHRC